MLLNRNLQQE